MRLPRAKTRIIEDKDFDRAMEKIEDAIEELQHKVKDLMKELKKCQNTQNQT